MYSWIWAHLPGPTAVKVVLAVVGVGICVALLFLVVFPWLTTVLPFTDTTVGVIDRSSAHSLGGLG